MTLQQINENSIFDFIRQNTYKYKIKDLEQYFSLRPLKNENDKKEREELFSTIKRYLIQ